MRDPFLLLCALAVGCGSAPLRPGTTVPTEDRPAADAGDAPGFASASNALGLDLWRALRATHGSGNLSISPASISTALAMTYGGAGSGTATAMATTMHLSSSPVDTMRAAGALVTSWNDPSRTDYELAVANRLFGASQYDFAEPFVAATRDAFGAELQRLDFESDAEAARASINGWVEERTHERIVDLLPSGSVDDGTRLVLVNAVYFHGAWEVPFVAESTYDQTFHAADGDRSVPTMHTTGGRFGRDGDVLLFERAYAGGDLAMLFVLPREAGGLSSVEDHLDSAAVARWAAAVADDEDLEVALPRFRIETESMSLHDPLVALGMGIAFSDDADFTAMSDPSEVPLKIDDVFHRVFVELNEQGTEAAAATAVTMVELASLSVRSPPPRFIADHPFLFFLRDVHTGAILFAGRVADPS